jgi:DNA mismatch repair protein MutL
MPDTAAMVRRPIRKLPALLVNQIAAGEVVERPASVVKELVDNALDAGATRISVELEAGGVELVRITDDGCGIPEGELSLALAAHATSKITAAQDLDRIGTMGFRGEALASIASVARVSIRSRTREQAGACEIRAEGDVVSEPAPVAGPVGTCVSVRNLFFNTPARRKFLRTPATEQGHCTDIVEQLAVAHPAVGFELLLDGRKVLELSSGHGPRERSVAVLGKELEGELLEVGADEFDDARGVALWGLVGRPSIARATAKAQLVFVNGRPVRDKTIQHAIKEAYRGLIEPGRWPTAVVMIEMDPGAVDVNVHPQKQEVRFRDQSLVHTVVLRAVREALRRADLTPAVEGAGGGGARGAGWAASDHDGTSSLLGPGRVDSPEKAAAALADFFKRFDARASGAAGAAAAPVTYEALRAAVGDVKPPAVESGDATSGPAPAAPAAQASAPPSDVGAAPAPGPALGAPAKPVLQVHNSYVVTQDEQGLVIIDQHALHERVMFEYLAGRVMGGSLESQRLLTPAVVEVGARVVGRLEELRPLLAKIGVEAEPLGPATVGVHAFPSFLFDRGVEPVEFVKQLLERADAEGFTPGTEAALHEVLDMMACKAAVKAGDRMTEPELLALLKLRETVERSSNCPHGRPTSIRMSLRELEKRFGRT